MTAKQRPDGVTRGMVLDYLIREADLDGLVTVSESEIAAALDVSQVTVSGHILNLAAEGFAAIAPRSAGYKGMNAIQLAEWVYA